MKKFLGLAVALLAIALVGCNGSPTSPTEKKGACCISGQCTLQTRLVCENQTGTYKGDDIACAADTCGVTQVSSLSVTPTTLRAGVEGQTLTYTLSYFGTATGTADFYAEDEQGFAYLGVSISVVHGTTTGTIVLGRLTPARWRLMLGQDRPAGPPPNVLVRSDIITIQ